MSKSRSRTKVRFSLRALLVLCAAFSFWLGIHTYRARQQESAVEAVEQSGGSVVYDWQPDIHKVDWPSRPPPDSRISPVWLRSLVGEHYFQSVVHVELTQPESSVIDELQRLAKLRSVHVNGWNYANDTLCKAAHCKSLTHLSLAYIRDEDLGLAHLRAAPQLRELRISHCTLTALELRTLEHMQFLKKLVFYSVDTIEGAWNGMTFPESLEELRIGDTAVSADVIEDLRRRLPDGCQLRCEYEVK
ncbi:hypothetical protein OAS39_08450 [Pirellulales bacterium]|nr:hypothetical protein [Pirellulales bacterium]